MGRADVSVAKHGKRHEGFFEALVGVMSKRAWRAVLWLFVGQAVQIAASVLAVNFGVANPVVFASAAGFIVSAAIIVGIVVGGGRD